MSDCFISYRRTPSAPVASSLQSKLESKYGLDVYVDTTRADSTHVRFPERLMQAIEDAPVFVCLLGERDDQHTLESGWVMKEIQQAYDLGKFCIPVFQESYRPLPDMPACVDYLLGFDGVHILDQKNIMIDESVRQIAGLIQPHRKKRLVTPARIGAVVGLVLVAVAAAIGIALSIANPDNPPAPPASPVVAQDTTPDATGTLEAMVANIIATKDAEDAATVLAYMPTSSPTITTSQTPDMTQISAAQNTEAAVIAAERLGTQHAQLTANAPTNTAEPTATASSTPTETPPPTATATHTPTITPNLPATAAAGTQIAQEALATINAQETATAESIPTSTTEPTPIPIAAIPIEIGLTPQTSNADWSPVERDFDGVRMVLVPAGCFRMGNSTGNAVEHPQHRRCFATPFWMDKYETKQVDFDRSGGHQAIASAFPSMNNPVTDVTWYEARDFCELRGGRLPSEMEWEYASRGPDNLIYPWGNQFIGDNLVYVSNSNRQPTFVGSRPHGESWVGAFNMSGNVWEWTRSAYQTYPYQKDDGRENTRSAARRVIRGGSWNSVADYLRSSYRIDVSQNHSSPSIGFRCMRAVD